LLSKHTESIGMKIKVMLDNKELIIWEELIKKIRIF
jgi:hypothetical protein